MTTIDAILVAWPACGLGVWLSVLRWAPPSGRRCMDLCHWLMLVVLAGFAGPLAVLLHASDVMDDDAPPP